MKNILLADDYPIVRLAVKNIIMKHLNVDRIDEADSELSIRKFVKKIRYDLIILDINMPSSDSIKTLEWLCSSFPATNILVLTMHEESFYGLRCLNMGAKGFLNKNCETSELVEGIRATLLGQTYISTTLSEIVAHAQRREKIANPFTKLSTRELEIAKFLNRGITLHNICSLLHIQYSTGNTYKRRIMEKLNVETVVSLSKLMSLYSIGGY